MSQQDQSKQMEQKVLEAALRQVAKQQPLSKQLIRSLSPQSLKLLMALVEQLKSAGAGGAARQDPGTAPADVRTNQQMGGSPANGTDSGQGSAGTDASGTEANIGERGGTGSTEQRSGDGRFSAVTGRLEESRSTVESNQILDEYQAQREQYYRESGYSEADAAKYANQDMATAAAINDFLAETRSEIDAQQMFSTIQSLRSVLPES